MNEKNMNIQSLTSENKNEVGFILNRKVFLNQNIPFECFK